MDSDRLIRLPEVKSITGLSRSELYNREREGRFPKRVPLSATTTAWSENEVRAWVQERLAERESAAAGRKQKGQHLREARARARAEQPA